MNLRNLFRSLLLALCTASFAAFALSGCSNNTKTQNEKPKYLWMCGQGNFARFTDRDTISHYLELAKQTGFNNIVVDVKPNEGNALYKSKIVAPLTKVKDFEYTRDWDYLQYVIDECRRLGMKVTASACVFPAGVPKYQRGPAYEDSTLTDLACIEYLPDGTFRDIREDTTVVAAFLSPVRPEARQYALSVLEEIVKNYDIDGLALDYCRFPDMRSDFSPAAREAFEVYIGEKVENFPTDIFTYDENSEVVPGKYYNQWLAFRANTVSDFIHTISDSVKAIKPDLELNYWAASWIHGIEKNGQNWASPKSDWCKNYFYGSDDYQRAGFAPYIDNFIVGTYLERVYGPDDNESVEYGLNRADSLLMGDCHSIGSIYSVNHSLNPDDPNGLKAAVKCCLEKSEGLMVFDIVHVINRNQWDVIRQAIDEYEQTNN